MKFKPIEDIFDYSYLSVTPTIQIRYGIAKRPIAPAKAILLLLQGRAECIEKYKGIAKQLQAKGFQVISLDWRGQGLSSRELENRHKGHIQRFDDYVDDLEAVYSRAIAPQGIPVYILAHSMGGHIALRFMSRHPLKIKRAVLASPMIDIVLPSMMRPAVKLIAHGLSKTAFVNKYVLGSKDYAFENVKFKGNNLCHDPEKFWILHNEIFHNPDLALGGVTWGWLSQALESIAILKHEDVIHKITTPILMVSAQKDTVVCPKAQERLSHQLPHCRFLSIEGGFHELLFEQRQMTRQFWDAFTLFMANPES
ncbi:alpha/beta hydrolase [Desulfobacula sp.]|uniref:alpha/beta hydrolase n=1 Tax=Desulfobacula sp. TaxID=2593537 RepID=UPI0026271E85|nr:alpha/beta hydrolase [Desulfobacula sp.]